MYRFMFSFGVLIILLLLMPHLLASNAEDYIVALQHSTKPTVSLSASPQASKSGNDLSRSDRNMFLPQSISDGAKLDSDIPSSFSESLSADAGAEPSKSEGLSQSLLIPIHYAKAEDLVKMIEAKQNSFLSEAGKISFDARSNSIWIKDHYSNVKSIRDLIRQLDRPLKQVFIKARIVNIDDSSIRDLGIEFGTAANSTQKEGGFSMDYSGLKMQAGHFNFPIAKLGSGVLLDLELTALQQEGHAKIISTPELVTRNRKTAIIESGEEIPYQEQTPTGATSVAFKKATLELQVTPEILPNHEIILKLKVNQDKMSALMVNGVPTIDTQHLETEVRVKNKQTIVLGGIYQTVDRTNNQGIPKLSRIPILGWLFKKHHHQQERKQLLVFVTPVVMD